MCTAISLVSGDHYFGRNFDYDFTLGEKVCITPRNYKFEFSNGEKFENHNAIIGVAFINNDYPLYFDAINEKGLSMAGLNFPHFAKYFDENEKKINVASYELIPWFLCKCNTVKEAKALAENLNITNKAFSPSMPPNTMHWIISDKEASIVLEQTKDGMHVYDNPVGVLSNSPSFDMQLFNLNNYMSLTNKKPENRFSDKINLETYCLGMGAMGLPGDNSSMSRFVRSAFIKYNSVFCETEEEKVRQFFLILCSVYQQSGVSRAGDKYEITNYTCCSNTDKGIYYFITYNNPAIKAVCMHNENLDTEKLISYDLYSDIKIDFLN